MGAVSGFWNYLAMEDQLDSQERMSFANMKFSKEMYEKQVADYMANYPTLQKIQADNEFNLWKNQFDTQNAYNNPSAQVARNLAAGLNPSQQGMITSSNNTMGAQSSVAPPPTLSGSPLAGNVSPVGLPFQGVDLATTLKEYSMFRKNMADANVSVKTLAKMDAETDKLFAEKDLIDSQRSYQEIKNGIYQVLGYRRETVEVMKLVKDAYQAEATGDYMRANKNFAEANKNLADSERLLNEEKLPWVSKIIQSEIDLNNARVRESNARAFEASENAKLANAKTDSEKVHKQILEFEHIIKGNDAKISSVTLQPKINAMKEELAKDKALSEKTKNEALIEIQKLNKILDMYRDHPTKLRFDATLKNFNENFPILSQLGSLAKGI